MIAQGGLQKWLQRSGLETREWGMVIKGRAPLKQKEPAHGQCQLWYRGLLWRLSYRINVSYSASVRGEGEALISFSSASWQRSN